MKIELNGKVTEFNDGISVSELINLKKLDPEGIVIELNMEIIKKDTRNATFLKEGDVVEILHFVGGG